VTDSEQLHSATAAYALPANALAEGAESLRAALLAVRDSGSVFRVDAQAVTFVDTRVLQLLVAATVDLDARGGSVLVEHPSPAFVDAVDTLGLRQHIKIGRTV